MKKILRPHMSFFVLCLALHQFAVSQNVGINATGVSPAASAMLDIASINKGLLIPRIALSGTNDAATIPSAAISLLIYNTATVAGANAVTPGYYSWSGTVWLRESNYNGTNWNLAGNAVATTDFIGTTNNIALNFKVNNFKAGVIDPTGPTFFGYQAGNVNTSIYNSAFGYKALYTNTNGNLNTANGYLSLYANTNGDYNTANGAYALNNNTYGWFNTANGCLSLYVNTTGGFNTSNGNSSLYSNTTGSYNTANGYSSLYSNTTGTYNTAIGSLALNLNTTGSNNTANGQSAMFRNTIGNYNTALGNLAGETNVSGSNNNFIGSYSDASVNNLINATAIGAYAEVAVSNAIVLGSINGVNSATASTNVGIGTTAPTAPLQVNGWANSPNTGFAYYAYNGSTVTGVASGVVDISIIASNRIRASEFNAVSDSRIKKVVSISNQKNDLEILSKIEVTDFKYLDKVAKGESVKKGFIAQQIESVFPEAVQIQSDFIPNIYKVAKKTTYDKIGKTLLIEIDTIHSLIVGDKIRIISPEGTKELSIISIPNNKTFAVKTDKEMTQVFVFGKEVNDFRSVDYDRVFTLNISATQQLLKLIEKQQDEIDNLNMENKTLKSDLDTLKAVLIKQQNETDLRLKNIESILNYTSNK